jgi:hypothetical protein
LQNGINIAIWIVFSTTGDKYNHCIRLNAAYWSEEVEQALAILGKTANSIVRSGTAVLTREHNEAKSIPEKNIISERKDKLKSRKN